MSKADNKKSRSRHEICLKHRYQKRNRKNKIIIVNKDMFIVHRKTLDKSLRHVTSC